MEQYVAVLLVLLCCLARCMALPFTKEPSCTVTSRFDFEEKLLEKMVRMELWAETLNTKVETDMDNLAKELRNMKTTIDTAVSEVGALEEATAKMKQDMDSTKKNDVVFHVQVVNGQPAPGAAITFKTTLENTGQAYNIGTGCFTAPTKGTYWFSAHLCSNNSKYTGPSIFIRDKLAARSYQRDSSRVPCDVVNAVTVLQAGDDVCLKTSTQADTGSVHTSPLYLTNDFMGARVN